MNTREGFSRVDTDTENEPFNSIDTVLARATRAALWVGVGMAITAALLWAGRFF